ncbi:bifunctional DNA primase/polymerase [Nocardiopsis dassonvillei]|uniref:bifunctional DNA primase/polymerase n=1 Tax=Nocardiopsis dassonvillei TaxID=2014 RepID=UPI00366F67E2
MNQDITNAAQQYVDRSFQVIPVNGKTLATKGVTGRDGTTDSVLPRDGQNVALRLPLGLIGIDVDAYDGKPGAETLAECERKWGPLPKTDRSGSRDGVSGIYVYRVPRSGWESITKLPGIEFVQFHHRYMVVEPSVHPDTGNVYRWDTVGNSPMWESGPESFPMLPPAWVEGLRKDNASSVPQKGTESFVEVLTDGSPCEEVEAVLKRFESDASEGKSRHDSMVSAQYRLAKLGEAGHPGVSTAMDTLESMFLAAVDGERNAQDEWNRALDGALRMVDTPNTNGDPCEDNNLNLPDSFWESRKSLKHIRTAAHSQASSADVVLYATLARMSAMVDHRTRVDTGVKSPASLNLFVAIVGKSGAGKTSGVSGALERLMPVPDTLEGFRDGLPLGSGEGIVEAYMGTVWEEDHNNLKKDGTPKQVQVRKQVRNNAFFRLDEGESLTKQLERSGTTVGPIMRSAWVGDLLGQANARQETTRILPRGSYAMGLLIGYQEETAGALLDDSAAGTPQRFLFCNATDPNIPHQRITHPGELSGYMLGDDDPFTDAVALTLHFPDDLKDELWKSQRELAAGEREVENELDSHEPLTRAKVAALLALLDGRVDVTREDWDLSGVVWETSCAVRDAVLNINREKARAEEERQINKRLREAERTELVKSNVNKKAKTVASSIARKVHDGGGMAATELRRGLRSDKRNVFAEALDYAEGQSWIMVDEDSFVTPGDAAPE